MNKTIRITGGGPGAFSVDAETGVPIWTEATADPTAITPSEVFEAYGHISKVDLDDYRAGWGPNLPAEIDVLDIGWWSNQDGYVPASCAVCREPFSTDRPRDHQDICVPCDREPAFKELL